MRAKLFSILITIFTLFAFYPAMASHLAGQDFTYVYLGDSTTAGGAVYQKYRVTLSIYDDCLNGNPQAIAEDNPAFIAIYTAAGVLVALDTTVYDISAVTEPVTINGSCDTIAVPPTCRLKLQFVQQFALPVSTTGYTIVYQRCCLNLVANITTSENQGIIATCTIPPSGTVTSNTSAVFNNYPYSILQLHTPLVYDCSATDPDGDSLTYDLCAAYNGADGLNVKPIPVAPPYTPYSYVAPLSYSNPMRCSVPLAIDPITGLLTGTPDTTGVYLISVCCHEWRGGVMINTVQRVFEFVAAVCTTGIPNISKGASLDIYPNPATTSLTITSSTTIGQVIISDLLGQTVYTSQPNTENVAVNISVLPPGLYFVKVNNTEVRKFVKE